MKQHDTLQANNKRADCDFEDMGKFAKVFGANPNDTMTTQGILKGFV